MFHYVSIDFAHWLSGLKDQALYACVLAYLCNMKNGDFGEINDVGDDVYETSLPSYPNLRFYFSKVRRVITILLVSDESNSQPEAVAKAKQTIRFITMLLRSEPRQYLQSMAWKRRLIWISECYTCTLTGCKERQDGR